MACQKLSAAYCCVLCCGYNGLSQAWSGDRSSNAASKLGYLLGGGGLRWRGVSGAALAGALHGAACRGGGLTWGDRAKMEAFKIREFEMPRQSTGTFGWSPAWGSSQGHACTVHVACEKVNSRAKPLTTSSSSSSSPPSRPAAARAAAALLGDMASVPLLMHTTGDFRNVSHTLNIYNKKPLNICVHPPTHIHTVTHLCAGGGCVQNSR